MKLKTKKRNQHWAEFVARFGIVLTMTVSISNAQESVSQTYRPKVGELHADFCLPQIGTSKAVSLSDYRGKKILLIHFASW